MLQEICVLLKSITEKLRKFSREIHMIFIDSVKAFNKVKIEKYFNMLNQRGFTKQYKY